MLNLIYILRRVMLLESHDSIILLHVLNPESGRQNTSKSAKQSNCKRVIYSFH